MAETAVLERCAALARPVNPRKPAQSFLSIVLPEEQRRYLPGDLSTVQVTSAAWFVGEQRAMFWKAIDYWTSRQGRSRWMTPAVAALVFGGCTPSESLFSTPKRLVHTASATTHNCVTAFHRGGWCYSRTLDDCRTASTARHVATRDLKQMVQQSGCRPSRDFARGFEQAYVDVALGGSGDVPAYPPQEYWELWQRTAEGHARAGEWFEGYAAGAEQAWVSFGDHNVIPTTGLADGDCEFPAGYAGP